MKKLFLSLTVALLSLVSLSAAVPGLTVLLPSGGRTYTVGSEAHLDFNSQVYGRLIIELASSVAGQSITLVSPCDGVPEVGCRNYYVSGNGFSTYVGRLLNVEPGKYRVSMSVVDGNGNVLASDQSDTDLTVIPETAKFIVFGKGQDNPQIWRVGSTQTVSFATYGVYDYGYLSLNTVGSENGYNLSSTYLEKDGFHTSTFVVRPWVQSGSYVVLGEGRSSFSGSYFTGESDLYVKVISSVIVPAEGQVVVAGRIVKATWLGKHMSNDKYAVTLHGSKLTDGPVFLNVASPLRGKVNVRIPKWAPAADDYYLHFTSSSLQSFSSDRFAIIKKKGDPVTHVPSNPNNGGGGGGVGVAIPVKG